MLSVGKSPLWKSRHLNDQLASLFSKSAQKLRLVLFKSFGKAHARHEQYLLLPCCTLLYLKHKSFCTIVNIATLVLHQLISEDICLTIREQQEVEIESMTTRLCASSVPRRLCARENQCRRQQLIAQRQRYNFSRRSQKKEKTHALSEQHAEG